MLTIIKEEHLLSKPVSLVTSSQANEFFLLSLTSIEVLSCKAGYFLTASLNLSSISFDVLFHLLFFFLPSVILCFTQNSLTVCFHYIGSLFGQRSMTLCSPMETEMLLDRSGTFPVSIWSYTIK